MAMAAGGGQQFFIQQARGLPPEVLRGERGPETAGVSMTAVIESCSAGQSEQQQSSVGGDSSPANLKTRTSQTPVEISEVKSSTSDHSIRSIDFANFTYPHDCVGIHKKEFTLR